MNHRQSWNIIAVFLLLVFGLSAATMLSTKRDFSETENRQLAQLPKAEAAAVLDGSFEQDYEQYLTDQFVLRDRWIYLSTLLQRAWLRQDVHDVYFAKDRYLIEKHSGIFEKEQAEHNRGFLQSFVRELSERFDAQHLSVMLVPNAVEILRDKLPPLAAASKEAEYLRSVQEGIAPGLWFDAGKILSQHAQEEIYYRTDHHWKTLGAFYIFQEWARQKGIAQVTEQDYQISTVTEDFEGTVASRIGLSGRADSIQIYEPSVQVNYVLTYDRSDDVRRSVYQNYKLDAKDKYAVFFGGNYGLIQAQTKAGTGRRLLVIKDSYAHCFAPFLFPYFDEVDLLDLRYFNESLSKFMQEQEYTDVLFLQNAAGFAQDASMSKLGL